MKEMTISAFQRALNTYQIPEETVTMQDLISSLQQPGETFPWGHVHLFFSISPLGRNMILVEISTWVLKLVVLLHLQGIIFTY